MPAPVLSAPPLPARLWRHARRAAWPVTRAALPARRRTYERTLRWCSVRDELPEVLNRRGLVGRGAEIGVQFGQFSERLLERWRGRELISIDPWSWSDDYDDIANRRQEEQEAVYRAACARLARFGERSTIWRTDSLSAAARLQPGELDFAYIDARHDYASVLEDLGAWFDRVRPGGVLAGHDYVDGALPAGDFGVKSAVDEFFGARGIPVHGTSEDGFWRTWMVEIPSAA